MNSNLYQPTNIDDFGYQCNLYPFGCNWTDLYAQWAAIQSLNLMADCYWVWDEQPLTMNYWNCSDQSNAVSCYAYEQSLLNNQLAAFDYSKQNKIASKDFNIVKRARRNPLPDIDDKLRQLLKLAVDGSQISFTASTKSARGLYHGVSERRSKYIGVLRNREQWQVLLNDGKRKKYIGTYETELEAALVNDFYAIGINGLSAKTNFSYSHSQVMAMIEQYFESNSQFDPAMFASQIFLINESL